MNGFTRLPYIRITVAVAIACSIGACSSTARRVRVPLDPTSDTPPTITVSAVPLVYADGTGDVEPGKYQVSQTTGVFVTRGAPFMILANAKSPGGVERFELVIEQPGLPPIRASTSQTKDGSGTALDTLGLRAPDGNPGGTLEVTVTELALVKAVATNFNGQSTEITVSYQPADLTVMLSAEPTEIGYQRPREAKLSWNVLHGKQIKTITGNVPGGSLDETMPAEGTAIVKPTQTTTYRVTATDTLTTRTASVIVRFVQAPPPPPAPEPKLTASPTDGRVCLGGEVTVTWMVGNCSSDCRVDLKGTGRDYATGKDFDMPGVPATGSLTFKPADRTDFVLTASSPAGTRTATKTVSVAPPDPVVCTSGSGNTSPTLKAFYLLIKPTKPYQTCTTVMGYFDTEASALAAAQQIWNGYIISVINASEFQTACTK